MAFELCRTLIYNLTNPAEIADWFTFLEATTSSSNKSTFSQPSSPSSLTNEAPLVYGPAAYHLRHLLLQYITQTLPTLLAAFGSSPLNANVQPAVNGGMNYSASGSLQNASTSSTGQQALIQVYAVLSFSVFKNVIESADFPPGDMERVRTLCLFSPI